MNLRSTLATVAASAMLAIGPVAFGSTTLQNLQTAYNGESNAHARYIAFAQQAEKENYGSVANLFRAAARAEEIHARNHARVIREMGGKPEAKIESADVKSTRENLEAAIKGETYERDTMYPEFLKQSQADYNGSASRTFSLAQEAESEHAKLYTAALAELDTVKGAAAPGYYVCPVCGFTTRNLDFERCPNCMNPKKNFERIS